VAETGADFEPRAGNTITAARVDEHFDYALAEASRYISGLDRTVVGLTLTLDPGFVHIDGTLVEFGSAVSEPLTPSATNYVYAEKDADITVNTTGTPPAGSILLFTFTTNGVGVTAEVDNRPNITAKVLDVDLMAPKLFRTDASDPVEDGELVRYDFLRSYVQSNGGNKTVRYSTTATIAHSGLGTQAGGDWPGALTAGDRILDKNNSTGADRGIWVAAAGAWTRATDYDVPAEVIPGSLVGVTDGTTLADTFWSLATEAPIVVGTTSLSFLQQDYRGHAALTGSSAHGATSAATANMIASRNGSGQSSFADGVNADHAATKGQLDANATADRARANHTGTQTASTISDFDTQVRTSRLDQMAAPTAAVSLNSQKITNLAAPTAATDAARLSDVTGGTGSAYSVAAAGLKSFEFQVVTTQATIGYTSSTLSGSGLHIILPGRTDDNDGFYPSGTSIGVVLMTHFEDGGADSDIFSAMGIDVNALSSVNGRDISVLSTRETDGGIDTDTLADWADGDNTVWEATITLLGNSTAAGFRVGDVVVKRNGVTVLTKTNRRINRSTSLLINFGGTTTTCRLMSMPICRILYP
jgi:hypothetical protein